jgi:hypothetical protein
MSCLPTITEPKGLTVANPTRHYACYLGLSLMGFPFGGILNVKALLPDADDEEMRTRQVPAVPWSGA